MCALLAVHDNTQEVNVILFESFLRESTVSPTLAWINEEWSMHLCTSYTTDNGARTL